MFGSRLLSDRLKSCMVAGRCLSAPAACDSVPSSVLCAAMAEETFIPTHIVQYADSVQQEVIGEILRDFSCKALLYGQCLMTVGAYVVRGIALSCGKRARAVRRSDGTFERVNPGSCGFALTTTTTTTRPPQPRPQPQTTHPTDDLASAVSSICLAIQGTPSPEGNLLPKQEAQVQVENSVEASELPFQELREMFEANVQPQQQPTHQQLQFDQDTAVQTLPSIQMGKGTIHTINNDHEHDTTRTIQFLLDKVSYLQNTIEKLSTKDTGRAQSTPMQVQISTPVGSGNAQLDTVDELQGPNDPHKAAFGHADLQSKIQNWAIGHSH